jgi:hypothetical protein
MCVCDTDPCAPPRACARLTGAPVRRAAGAHTAGMRGGGVRDVGARAALRGCCTGGRAPLRRALLLSVARASGPWLLTAPGAAVLLPAPGR